MSTGPTPDPSAPDVPQHHAELAHFAAAAVAAMALVPLFACTFSLGQEPGTESWEKWLFGLLLLAAGYLLAIAFTHLGEAWRGADRMPPALWLTLLRCAVDLAVASLGAWLLVRGPDSRVLLSGLGDALPGLSAAAGASAVVAIYSRSRETLDPQVADRSRRGGFHVVIGLLLVAGFIVCERQPLPRIEPSVNAAAVSPK